MTATRSSDSTAPTPSGADPGPASIRGVPIDDTFAEAFPMRGARIVITAATMRWARQAATTMTGFATSVIGCKCEAGDRT